MKTREARRIRRTHRGRASFNNDGRHSAQNGASPRRRRPQKTALRLGRRSQRARFSRGTTSGRSELTEAVPPQNRLVVWGGGPVAEPFCSLLLRPRARAFCAFCGRPLFTST